jgi:hypothetical protein
MLAQPTGASIARLGLPARRLPSSRALCASTVPRALPARLTSVVCPRNLSSGLLSARLACAASSATAQEARQDTDDAARAIRQINSWEQFVNQCLDANFNAFQGYSAVRKLSEVRRCVPSAVAVHAACVRTAACAPTVRWCSRLPSVYAFDANRY